VRAKRLSPPTTLTCSAPPPPPKTTHEHKRSTPCWRVDMQRQVRGGFGGRFECGHTHDATATETRSLGLPVRTNAFARVMLMPPDSNIKRIGNRLYNTTSSRFPSCCPRPLVPYADDGRACARTLCRNAGAGANAEVGNDGRFIQLLLGLSGGPKLERGMRNTSATAAAAAPPPQLECFAGLAFNIRNSASRKPASKPNASSTRPSCKGHKTHE